MAYTPLHYIGVPIDVSFDEPPLLEKKPACPNGFVWGNAHYRVAAVLAEWFDYSRRGRAARNMQPQHAAVAEHRGSWGVGRHYFRVRVTEGRLFELYYDRAPKGSDQRKGAWFLVSELQEQG